LHTVKKRAFILLLILLLSLPLAVKSVWAAPLFEEETPDPGTNLSETPANTPEITPFVTLPNTATISPTSILSLIPTITPFPTKSDVGCPTGNFVGGEIVVGFPSDDHENSSTPLLTSINASIKASIDQVNVLLIQVENGSECEAINLFNSQDGVLFAEPNYIATTLDTIPNDPGWPLQPNLEAIRAPAAWDIHTGTESITIAVLDTGVDLNHPDLISKLMVGYDFVNDDAVPFDDNGHGTHVAAIAASATNNGIGTAGVSWGARILPVKVLDQAGNGTYARVAQGIIWATDWGAQVINLSLGGPNPSQVLQQAVDYAHQRGVVLVAATGNSGIQGVLYPARYDPVIAVAAVDSANNRAGFSNFGPEVDLAAPGVAVYAAYPGGGYGYRSGTSMSAPHVAGAAALLASLPGSHAALVRWQLEATALDLGTAGRDSYFGSGLIQLDAAIGKGVPGLPTFTPTSTIRTRTPVPAQTKSTSLFPATTPFPSTNPKRDLHQPDSTSSSINKRDGTVESRLERSFSPSEFSAMNDEQKNKPLLTNNLKDGAVTTTSLASDDMLDWMLPVGVSFVILGIIILIYSISIRKYAIENYE
jgi:thermitase